VVSMLAPSLSSSSPPFPVYFMPGIASLPQVREVLTASARERQDAKVQRVTVELTVEEERRQFEADLMERASEAIQEVGFVLVFPLCGGCAHSVLCCRLCFEPKGRCDGECVHGRVCVCVGVWVCGCVGVRVCGCGGMGVCGFVCLWVCGFMGVWKGDVPSSYSRAMSLRAVAGCVVVWGTVQCHHTSQGQCASLPRPITPFYHCGPYLHHPCVSAQARCGGGYRRCQLPA
jgi:hypothetical protein